MWFIELIKIGYQENLIFLKDAINHRFERFVSQNLFHFQDFLWTPVEKKKPRIIIIYKIRSGYDLHNFIHINFNPRSDNVTIASRSSELVLAFFLSSHVMRATSLELEKDWFRSLGVFPKVSYILISCNKNTRICWQMGTK